MTKTIFEKHVPGRKGCTLPKNDVSLVLADCIPQKYQREKAARLPEVSELDAMRHFIELSHRNHFIEKGFYPLGSCTMKYNPKLHENLVRNCAFTDLHPLQSEATSQGALRIMYELQQDLAEISGFARVSIQPVAGAQGEFTGLKIIHAYHKANGNLHKNKIIMPDSAHGTNPASCTLAGFEVVEIKSNARGMVDLEALGNAVDENVAGFMLTNPNTLGIFESQLEEIARIIHRVDGLMYMDGANFNALLGLVKPHQLGFDVMHFNLHKTFATPHGGGGPGSGPVGVSEKLVPFLPSPMVEKGTDQQYYLDYTHASTSIGKVHSFYGNFSQNLRAWIYIKMLSAEGLSRVSENAIINANYIRKSLENYFLIPHNEICMHEFVASGDLQKKNFGIKTLDIAKRLLDKGYHAPTIYFPLIVSEAIMIEPTETESKDTLDEFIGAMIEIAHECEHNPDVVKNAPSLTPVTRVDDTLAVKKMDVKFNIEA